MNSGVWLSHGALVQEFPVSAGHDGVDCCQCVRCDQPSQAGITIYPTGKVIGFAERRNATFPRKERPERTAFSASSTMTARGSNHFHNWRQKWSACSEEW